MANRFWTGAVTSGTGTWDATSTANWSATTGGTGGAAAPGVGDAVIFDASSGAGVVTIGTGAVGLTQTMTGYTGTLAFGTKSISLAGNAATIFTGDTTYSVTGTPVINLTYAGSTGTRTLDQLAVTEANSISFYIQAGTDTFQVSGSLKTLDLTGFAGTYINSGPSMTVYGDLIYSTGLTVSGTGSGLTFAATSGTHLINTQGKTTVRALTFNGGGGTWQFQSNFTADSSRQLILTNGTVDLNGKTILVGNFASNNTNTRALLATGATMQLALNNFAVWSVPDTTGFTMTGIPSVQLTYSGATGTRTISHGSTAGGSETNCPNISVTAGTDTVAITAGGKIGNLDFTGFAGTRTNTAYTLYGSPTYSTGMTITAGANVVTLGATSGTKTITSNGKTLDFPITISGGAIYICADALTLGSTRALTLSAGTLKLKAGATSTVGSFVTTGTTMKALLSTTLGTQATISDDSGTNSPTYITVQDIAATGGATWDASGTGFVNGGNNSGWTSLPPFIGLLGGRGLTLSMGLHL